MKEKLRWVWSAIRCTVDPANCACGINTSAKGVSVFCGSADPAICGDQLGLVGQTTPNVFKTSYFKPRSRSLLSTFMTKQLSYPYSKSMLNYSTGVLIHKLFEQHIMSYSKPEAPKGLQDLKWGQNCMKSWILWHSHPVLIFSYIPACGKKEKHNLGHTLLFYRSTKKKTEGAPSDHVINE